MQSGARVAKGAVLVRINSAVDTAGGDTQARVLAALQAQHLVNKLASIYLNIEATFN